MSYLERSHRIVTPVAPLIPTRAGARVKAFGRRAAVLTFGLALSLSARSFAQQCSCDPLLPPCTTVSAKWMNEDGNGPLRFVSAGGAGGSNVPVTHANRFDFPPGAVITHVCVALKSPTGGVGQPAEIRISGELAGFPGVPFHSTPFVIAPTGPLADHQIVALNAPIGVAGITWVQVHYPTARATIGHQGTRPLTAQRSAVQPQGFAWEDYQNIPVLGYQGQAAIIRPMTLAPTLNGVTLIPLSPLETSESGGRALFEVGLVGTLPLADVVIGFATSDPCEGRAEPAQLVFTPAGAGVTQLVEVLGIDDGLFDRDQAYDLLAGPTLSLDPCWNGLPVGTVPLVNRDDEISACTLGFSAATSLAVAAAPLALAAGEMNGDGLIDLVSLSRVANSVTVQLNQGGGTFGAGTSAGTGAFPEDVCLLDADHDLDLDVLVANGGAGTLSIHRNDGSGGLLAPLTFSVGADPRAIAVGDLDGNGWSDIVTANTNPPSNNLSMLLASGPAAFLPEVDIAVGTNPIDLVTADLDGNGTLDIAVANYASQNVSILLNGGAATFAHTLVGAGGGSPNTLVAGDWDLDGDIDLAVGRDGANDVALFENNGAAGFTLAGTVFVGDFPAELVASDFDQDGDLDLAVTIVNGLAVAVLENLNGTFASIGSQALGSAPSGLAAGDLDGNGAVDLAVANSASGDLSLLFGTCVSTNGLELECPSPSLAGATNVFTARGATPSQRVYFLAGFLPCSRGGPGFVRQTAGLRDPRLIGFGQANGGGIATLTTFVPLFLQGQTMRLQAVELSNCRASPVMRTVFQ